MSTYTPEYIAQVMSYVSGDTVTADELNTVLNKIIHQGDHNSEWLNYLDTVGIPAAVAEISQEGIEEYIEEVVDEEIQQLTASASSRTTGFTSSKDVVIINNGTALSAAVSVGICNKWTPSSMNTVPPNPVAYGYSGSDITAMTSENRASDCSSLRGAIYSANLTKLPVIYQSKSADAGINHDYLVNNLSGYLYKVTAFKTNASVFANQLAGKPMQFPVVEFDTPALALSGLANASIDTCNIICTDVASLDNAGVTAFKASIVAAGFNILTLDEFLQKWLHNVTYGANVYSSQLTHGRQIYYNNKLTNKTYICVSKPDGTEAVFDYTDVMKLSQEKLTFTNTDGSLVVTNAAGQTVITYTPTAAVIDNSLVGNTTTTSELPVVVANSGSGSGQSYVNTTFKIGNGVAKINNKNIPWVSSYNSTTGVLVLGGI